MDAILGQDGCVALSPSANFMDALAELGLLCVTLVLAGVIVGWTLKSRVGQPVHTSASVASSQVFAALR